MIRMHFLEGVADEQIARSMNLTIGAVRGTIYRAKQRIRSLMGSSSKFYSDAG